VLDGGQIVEDGKYEELLEKGGLFSELIKRQQVDI
jgi:ABC-type multidrug transport system fused ATPase/permease subunit